MLRRYLTVSLLAHAALFIVWGVPAPKLLPAGQKLSIDLLAAPKPAPATVVAGAAAASGAQSHTAGRVSTGKMAPTDKLPGRQYAKARSEQHHIEPNTATLAAREGSVARQPAQAGSAESNPLVNYAAANSLSASVGGAAAAQRGSSNDTSTSIRVRARLLQALRDHYSYPKIARRYGWEGLVEMHLRVEADGRLSHIEMVRSSGYAALDQAALSSTRRIDTVVEAAAWLHGSYIDVSLPVEYRLTDG